jgi:hypothetical protein
LIHALIDVACVWAVVLGAMLWALSRNNPPDCHG